MTCLKDTYSDLKLINQKTPNWVQLLLPWYSIPFNISAIYEWQLLKIKLCILSEYAFEVSITCSNTNFSTRLANLAKFTVARGGFFDLLLIQDLELVGLAEGQVVDGDRVGPREVEAVPVAVHEADVADEREEGGDEGQGGPDD